MTQVAILQGILTDNNASILESIPINLEPSLATSNISEGYLTSTPGITTLGTDDVGADRASINWNGVNYRIQGTKLISVSSSGESTIIGDVGNNGNPVFMDYGVDRLAIASDGFLWYFDGTTLSKVVDPDAVNVFSVLWIDGYFIFTDTQYLVSTQLNDPTNIIANKYATAEIDPDPILGIIKVRDELYAIGQYTIQNFQNVGGSGFPFANNKSAFIPRGAVGPKAFCEYLNSIAFIGSAKDEAVSVYIGSSSDSVSIATSYIESILQSLTLEQQVAIEMETIVNAKEQRLLIHLEDKTLVYNYETSKAAGTPVWNILAGGIYGNQIYPIRHFSYVYNRFIGGNPVTGRIGYLDASVSTQFELPVGWEFQTSFLYNQGGFTVTNVELIAATGRTPLGDDPRIFFSYSNDGTTFSQEKSIPQGKQGQYQKKLAWRPMSRSSNYQIFKFRGANTSIASIMRLDAEVEPQVL